MRKQHIKSASTFPVWSRSPGRRRPLTCLLNGVRDDMDPSLPGSMEGLRLLLLIELDLRERADCEPKDGALVLLGDGG